MSIPPTDGQAVRVVYNGALWTVIRTSTATGDLMIYCKEGHPPKWGGRTNWFFPDELAEEVSDV